MPHPLATHLAPLIDRDIDELREIVARWVLNESSEAERARYRRFGAELGALKARISAQKVAPSDEEVEMALSALLAIVGNRADDTERQP